MRAFLFAISLFFASGSVFASQLRPFENFALPASSLGMGSVGVAGGIGPEFMALNPASIGLSPAGSMYLAGEASILEMDQSLSNLSISFRDASLGALGASFQSYSLEGINGFTSAGVSSGTLSYVSRRYALDYAYQIQGLAATLGIAGEGYSEDLFGNQATSTTGRLGLVIQPIKGHFNLGFAVAGLGSGRQLTGAGTENDPLSYYGGMGFDFAPVPLRAEIDLDIDGTTQYDFGVEAPIWETVFLRGGYAQAPTLGAGLRLDYMVIDYAYLFPLGQAAAVQRISASFAFDLNRPADMKVFFKSDPVYPDLEELKESLKGTSASLLRNKQPVPYEIADKDLSVFEQRLAQLDSIGDTNIVKTAGVTDRQRKAAVSVRNALRGAWGSPYASHSSPESMTLTASPTPTPTPSPSPTPVMIKAGSDIYKNLQVLAKILPGNLAGRVNSQSPLAPAEVTEAVEALRKKADKLRKLDDPDLMTNAGYGAKEMEAIKAVEASIRSGF